jgi:hypothetical protein
MTCQTAILQVCHQPPDLARRLSATAKRLQNLKMIQEGTGHSGLGSWQTMVFPIIMSTCRMDECNGQPLNLLSKIQLTQTRLPLDQIRRDSAFTPTIPMCNHSTICRQSRGLDRVQDPPLGFRCGLSNQNPYKWSLLPLNVLQSRCNSPWSLLR